MKKLILCLSAILALVLSGDSFAVRTAVSIDSIAPGPTPFISFVTFRVSDPANLASVSFDIHPKQGSRTRHVAATYSADYLRRSGYFRSRSGQVTVPVFGLYKNRSNSVKFVSTFANGTTQLNSAKIVTPDYVNVPYTDPTIVQPRLQNTTLSFDFVLLKAYIGTDTPVIIDSDGEVRWVGSAARGGQQSLLYNNGIYVAGGTSIVRLEFDGRKQTLADYAASQGITGIHHNFDYGRDGIIMEVDKSNQPEAALLEVDGAGTVLHTWDMQQIVTNAMIAGGDNPAGFVLPGQDWFHNNATAYRPSDDSLIISSRENFVMAIDYDTAAIKWLLGDPTKHWHDFPSLRAFALSLGPDTLPPIGQHATSIVRDDLLLFDDGQQSAIEMPPGEERTYSAPRKYTIAHNTATEVWHYLADPPNFSPFCSSVYEDTTDNYLIDYTLSHNFSSTDIVALDNTGSIAFYYSYAIIDGGCGTSFYANPIHLENLQFQ